ncbi:hypothetical protein CBR_g31150 [Chara braunii]|uniref:Uncharacterized protein n=1 Tax=Chara braunii TaxID=69332 RepID=A0A388LEG8_CHABU|nr:hypothetical protein CBR_g31150 [Chara braunii]|eukprot:GBG80691.1 hypothetical protein CBR_g31150 [Chara braunii]
MEDGRVQVGGGRVQVGGGRVKVGGRESEGGRRESEGGRRESEGLGWQAVQRSVSTISIVLVWVCKLHDRKHTLWRDHLLLPGILLIVGDSHSPLRCLVPLTSETWAINLEWVLAWCGDKRSCCTVPRHREHGQLGNPFWWYRGTENMGKWDSSGGTEARRTRQMGRLWWYLGTNGRMEFSWFYLRTKRLDLMVGFGNKRLDVVIGFRTTSWM